VPIGGLAEIVKNYFGGHWHLLTRQKPPKPARRPSSQNRHLYWVRMKKKNEVPILKIRSATVVPRQSGQFNHRNPFSQRNFGTRLLAHICGQILPVKFFPTCAKLLL
jgi:hypothetical protein